MEIEKLEDWLIKHEGEIRFTKGKPEPGDVVVVYVPEETNQDRQTHILEVLKEVLPDNHSIIIPEPLRLEFIKVGDK